MNGMGFRLPDPLHMPLPADIEPEFDECALHVEKRLGRRRGRVDRLLRRAQGTGVRKIRIRKGGGVFRPLYVTQIADAAMVFHALARKTQNTPKRDLVSGWSDRL